MKKHYLFCCALLLSISYTYYTHTMQEEHNSNQADPIAQVEQCGICLENLAPANTDDPLQRLDCGHEYCYSCIAHWAGVFRYPDSPTCPQCRALFTLEPGHANPALLPERSARAEEALPYARGHRYVFAGTALAVTGALAYKYRKPLANLLAQTKAKVQHAYRKLLALRLCKLQKAQTQTDIH